MLNPTINFLRSLWIGRGYTNEQAQAIAERDYKATGAFTTTMIYILTL